MYLRRLRAPAHDSKNTKLLTDFDEICYLKKKQLLRTCVRIGCSRPVAQVLQKPFDLSLSDGPVAEDDDLTTAHDADRPD